jgi:CDP-glucose 4,6-dehydratase
VVKHILRAMGSSLEPEVLGQASNEIRRQLLSAERARTELTWSPLFTLDEGLERAISWYREFFA